MKIPFIEIFSFIKICLSADYVSDPIIELQPSTRLRSINNSFDMCNGPLRNSPPTTRLTTSNYNSLILELKFLINYKNFLSYYNPTQEVVTLKKYKKKLTPDEKYDESLHTPQNILLSGENSKATGFEIDIRVPEENDFGLLDNNIGEKRKVVSFHSSSKTPVTDVTEIKKLNEQLLTYMVDDIDELPSLGFQFSFMVTAVNAEGEMVTKTVVSDLFGLEDNECEMIILTRVLNPNNFHIAPLPQTIDEEKRGKPTKFFCGKTKSEKKNKCVIS